jgi:hypothetical protein
MLASTIAAYIAASNATRSGGTTVVSRKGAASKENTQRAGSSAECRVPSKEHGGGQALAEQAGWVLTAVEVETRHSEVDPRNSVSERMVRFKWTFYFAHPSAGRVWDTSLPHLNVEIYRKMGEAETPTEEETAKVLAKAWDMLYVNLRRSEFDAAG